MTLTFKTGKAKVTFAYTDDNMMAAFEIKEEDGEEKLLATMRRVIAFYDAQTGREPLPRRDPGLTLEMTQMAHPPMAPAPPANGWAVMTAPDLPERLKNEVEIIPPEEQS